MHRGADLVFSRTLGGGYEHANNESGAEPKKGKNLEEEASHIT
jgi:hypothetical protein